MKRSKHSKRKARELIRRMKRGFWFSRVTDFCEALSFDLTQEAAKVCSGEQSRADSDGT